MNKGLGQFIVFFAVIVAAVYTANYLQNRKRAGR